jgi:hypothetical protein
MFTVSFKALSLNPVQVMSAGAEEEKAETARMVSDLYDSQTASRDWFCLLITCCEPVFHPD